MEQQSIYHERQSKQLCLLHSLNNLFQYKAFDKQDFDLICEKLSPNSFINPHKSPIGFGNYDINVMIAALETKDHDACWFDKRKNISLLNLDKIFGFILNLPVQKTLLGYINPLNYISERNHWIAIKKINSIWYNLNSKFIRPKQIGDDKELLVFLERKSKDVNCQILIIVDRSLKEEIYLDTNVASS